MKGYLKNMSTKQSKLKLQNAKEYLPEMLSTYSKLILTKIHFYFEDYVHVFSTVVVIYINTMKTIFYFNLYTKLSNRGVTYQHENKEKLPVNSFSLCTDKLVIWKKLVRNKVLIEKSSSLYWYKRRPLCLI